MRKMKNKPSGGVTKTKYAWILLSLTAVILLSVWIYLAVKIISHKPSEPQNVVSHSTSIDSLGVRYTAPDSSFSVNFPSAPTQTSNPSTSASGNKYDAPNQTRDTRYSVQVFQYPQYTPYIRDNQRQILEQLMQQINDEYSARVNKAPNSDQYMCGHSASAEKFTYTKDGVTHEGQVVAYLDYNTFYVLAVYGRNTDTFKSFVNSFAPKDGCKFTTSL